MSDSWILIGLTILIVFLLFYMSKRLICSGPILTNSNEENAENGDCPLPCDIENEGCQIKSICHSTNNNLIDCTIKNSQKLENRLRLQIFNMILAERKYEQLELEVHRLASLLSFDQGASSAEDCIMNLRNELYPLTTVNSFQSQLFNGGRLPKYQNGIQFNNIVNIVEEINGGGVEQQTANNRNHPDVICTTQELQNNSSIPDYRLTEIQGSLEQSKDDDGEQLRVQRSELDQTTPNSDVNISKSDIAAG